MAAYFSSKAISKPLIGALLLSAALLHTSQAQALALGRMTVVSTQQQPLVMEVALAETQGVIAGAIRPAIASAGEFAVAGLDYQLWFKDIDVQVVQRDEQLLLSLTSPQPVAAESLDLLIQVEYMGGRLLGQFAAEFKPAGAQPPAPTAQPEPVLGSEPEQDKEPVVETNSLEQVEVNVAAVSADEQQIAEDKQQLEALVKEVEAKAKPAPKPVPATSTPVATPKQVTVQAGQTLWRIAAQNTPTGTNTWQALMAIYKTNTGAFKDKQINRIMAGAKLTMPSVALMQEMSAAQAKSAYEQLLASYQLAKEQSKVIKVTPQPQPEPQQPNDQIAEQQRQAQKQAREQAQEQAKQRAELAELNNSIAKLQHQSSGMQEQLTKLEAERLSAEQKAAQLAQQNESLAAGLADQQHDLQALSVDKQALQKDLSNLGKQVSATDGELKSKLQQLQDLETELLDLQRQKMIMQNAQQAAASTPASTQKAEAKAQQGLSKQLYPWLMGGLVALLIGLLFSLLWRWLNGRPKKADIVTEPPMQESSPAVSIDPLADYDARPSSQSQALHEAAERMRETDQQDISQDQAEASFIEQLLQEQAASPARAQEDSVHLSAEVEALLQQQRQANDHRHEPQGYTNAEDAIMEKLDLARSYKQMGQVAEAQKLLQEVLHQGNLEQQTEATLLLSRMRQD